MRTFSPEEMRKVISYKEMNTEFAVGYNDAISKFHIFCQDQSRDNLILTYMCGQDSKDHKLCFVFEKESPSSMKIAIIDSLVPSPEKRSAFNLLRDLPKEAQQKGFKGIEVFANKYKRLGAEYGCSAISISDVEIATKLLQNKSLFRDLKEGIIDEIKTQEEGVRFYSGDLPPEFMEVCQLVTNREANTSIAEYLSRSSSKPYADRLQKLQLISAPNRQNDQYMKELSLILDLPDIDPLPEIVDRGNTTIEPLNTSLIHSAEQEEHGWCRRICREIQQRIMGRGIGQ